MRNKFRICNHGYVVVLQNSPNIGAHVNKFSFLLIIIQIGIDDVSLNEDRKNESGGLR